MLIVLQLVLYCVLFLVPIKCALNNNGINCLYFYPKEYIEEAQRRGIIDDKDAVMQKGKRFMVPFPCGCVFVFQKRSSILSRYIFSLTLSRYSGRVM